jgi:hypothetical protein
VSPHIAIQPVANLAILPRFSEGRESQSGPLLDKDLRQFGYSRYSRSHACTCAGARARGAGVGDGESPESPESPESHSAPPLNVTLLKHCRCMDCHNFSRVGEDYVCTEDIGGTKVRWWGGQHECDPPPAAWHYCTCYDGPQISTDVWPWPRTSRHVPPRSNISVEAEQVYGHAPACRHVADHQTGQGGRFVVPPECLGRVDRDGGSRPLSFCLSQWRTRP